MSPDEFRKIRKAAGLTQGEMAKRLGVSRLTICNWEGAKFRIPDDVLDRLAATGALVPALAPANKSSARVVKDALEAYRHMRGQPAPNNTHKYILWFWQSQGFTPSPEAQAAILAEFPDILQPANEKE